MNSSISFATLTNEFEFLELSRLYQIIASSANPAFFNWNQKTALEEIRTASNLVCRTDGFIRSFISYRNLPDRLEISALGTDPQFQRQGKLKLLLNQLKKCATEQNRPIWLEVHAENLGALGLYGRCGFRAVHRRKQYYQDRGDAVVMTWADGSS